jgi:hypothetical protein
MSEKNGDGVGVSGQRSDKPANIHYPVGARLAREPVGVEFQAYRVEAFAGKPGSNESSHLIVQMLQPRSLFFRGVSILDVSPGLSLNKNL